MVSINYFNINSKTKTLDISLSLSKGDAVKKVVLYHNEKYSKREGTDVLSLFLNTDISKVSVPTSIVEDTKGIWIVEITSAENQVIGVATDFSHYHSCVLNKLLKLDINGCEVKEPKDECDGCEGNTLYAYAILETLIEAVNYKNFTEAFLLMKQLDELCQECSNPSSVQSKACGCSHRVFQNSIFYGR